MDPTSTKPAESVIAAPAAPAEEARFDARRTILRAALSIGLFFVFMAVLAKLLGPQIEAAGQSFVDRFGLVGLALGTVVADGFSLPPPPLFYIVIVATSTGSHVAGLTVISVASVIAGNIGYRLSALLSARPFFKRRIDVTRARMDRMFDRYGVWAFAIAQFTPLPFSIMCYVAGVYRVKPWLFALVCLFRIPRLLVMYWLVRAGWMTGGG